MFACIIFSGYILHILLSTKLFFVESFHATTCYSMYIILQQQWTPLHKAANNGHNEIVRVLISAGADVESREAVSS